jgi:hypothetical protein
MLANALNQGKAVVLASLLTLAAPGITHAGPALTRLSAETTAIDGKVILLPQTTPPSAGGIQIYNNTLKVPGGNNIMYVTFAASGLGSGGIALNCQVDGANCLNGTGTAGTGSVASIPTGWVIPLGNEFDGDTFFGATGLGFQWCIPLTKTKGGSHSIALNAASAFGSSGQDEWLEAVSVFVDVNSIKAGTTNACGTYPTPNPVDSPDVRFLSKSR